MSRLSRFLPKFLRGDKSGGQKTGDKSQCKIMFLDDTEYFIPYKGGFKGQFALDRAFEQLNLYEKDYFGLRYIDLTGQTHWLDCNKTLSSQLKGCAIPYTLYFGVKFYPADPCKLKEEITRYEFFLQVKRDILHGRLPVTFEEAAELFAYAIQSELGDFESQKLPPGYVSEFQFVPNQTEELEEQIAALHRRLGGTVPATAELKFLDKVKWLDMYGVDLHPVTGESNTEYFLGLTPTGIVVYKNKTKVGNYFWPRITKVNMKGKVFMVKVKDKINEEHLYAFELATKSACKHLWKCCLEHHTFFRLNQLGASSTRTTKAYRSTAKHRNSGRQDRQNTSDHNGREQPQVLRVQSRRQARRAMSDTRLNHGDIVTGIQYSEGHVTMVVNPEHVKGSRHRSLPDLKNRGSPTSTRSAPWENNMDAGLYTSGRESPVSVTQSENVNYLRRHRDSDSESGYRRNRHKIGYDSDGGTRNKSGYQIFYKDYQSQQSLTGRSGYDSDALSSRASVRRRKYFPSSRKGSDNESDASFSRRKRRDDSGSESDVSPKYTARQRKTKSVGADHFEREWNDAMQHVYLPDKENKPNGSVHSAPLGESRQKKMRRRRSKSPGNSKRPPEELRQHIEFDLIEPPEEVTEDQLREIPYVNVETKAEAFKLKYSPSNRRRYRSPKRKSMGDLDINVKNGYNSDVQKYNHTPERTPEPVHKQYNNKQTTGYYSDTGSMSKRGQNTSIVSQQQYNNTLPSHSKHIVSDIRSKPLFHENTLFYDPKQSPYYHPKSSLQKYHPPPTAVFKPIETNPNQRNNTSMHSTSDTKVNDHHSNTDLDIEGQGQISNDIGEGHDTVDDRSSGSGLNGSSGNLGMFKNSPRGIGHKFGTQDAITRLYSSPAGTRKPVNTGYQQDDRTSNQNSSYSMNNGLTNGNSGYNQHNSYSHVTPSNQHGSYNHGNPTNQHGSYNHANSTNPHGSYNRANPANQQGSYNYMQDGSPQTFNRYDNNSNIVKTVSSVREPISQSGVQFQKERHEQPQYYQPHNQSELGNHSRQSLPKTDHQKMFSNDLFYSHDSPQTQGYMGNIVDSNFDQTGSRPVRSSSGYNQQSVPDNSVISHTPTNKYPPYQSHNNYVGNQSTDSPQNRYSPQKPANNYSGNQSTKMEDRLGLQPSWQYVNNGRYRDGTDNVNSRQKNSPNTSVNDRSPAQSASNRRRHIELTPTQDRRNVLSNHNSSNLQKYQSPDSAINSLSSLTISNTSRSSPNKNSQRPNMDISENFSRERTPAFGMSEKWTEL